MEKAMRVRFAVIAVLGVALVIAVAPLAPESQPKVTVGVLLPLTGAMAGVGKVSHEAIEGVLKAEPKIEVVIADDQSKPDTAAQETERLVKDRKAVVIIGTTSMPVALAVAQRAGEAKVPLVPLAAPSRDQQRELLKANPSTISFSPVTEAYVDALRAHLGRTGVRALTSVTAFGFGPLLATVDQRLSPHVATRTLRELAKPEEVVDFARQVKGQAAFVVGVMPESAAHQLITAFRKEGATTRATLFSPARFGTKGEVAALLVRNAVRKGATTPDRLFAEMSADQIIDRERRDIRLEWTVFTYATSAELMKSFRPTSSETVTCTCNSKDGKICKQVSCPKGQGCKRDERDDTCEVSCGS